MLFFVTFSQRLKEDMIVLNLNLCTNTLTFTLSVYILGLVYDIAWPFHILQPAWVCSVAPSDWWVGMGRGNLSPGYNTALVMDGSSEVLAELMGHGPERAPSWELEDRSGGQGWGCKEGQRWECGKKQKYDTICVLWSVKSMQITVNLQGCFFYANTATTRSEIDFCYRR